MSEPNWKEKYFALATAVVAYQKTVLDVEKGKADGGQYWASFNEMERLLGEALCWQNDPVLYAQLLARQPARPSQDGGDREGQG